MDELRQAIKQNNPNLNHRQRRKLERAHMQANIENATAPTNTFGFFLVWNPQGRAPAKRHATIVEAQDEAARLAAACPAQSFYVMSACSVSRGVTNIVNEVVHYPASALRPREAGVSF